MSLPGSYGLRQFHRLANWSDFSLFYLESRPARLFFFAVCNPAKVVGINLPLRNNLRIFFKDTILRAEERKRRNLNAAYGIS